MLKSYDRVKIYLDKFDKYYNGFLDSGIYDSIIDFRYYVLEQLNISFGSKDTLFDIHDVSDCNTITTMKQKIRDIDRINHIPTNDTEVRRFLYIIDKLNYNIYTLTIQDKCKLSYYSPYTSKIISSQKFSSIVKRSNVEIYYCVIKGKYRNYNRINILPKENVRVLRINNYDIAELVNSKNQLPSSTAIYNLNYGNMQFLPKSSIHIEFDFNDNSLTSVNEVFDKSGYCIARQRLNLKHRLKNFVIDKFYRSSTIDNINFLIDKHNLLIEKANNLPLTKEKDLLEPLYTLIENIHLSLKHHNIVPISEFNVYMEYLDGMELIHKINQRASYTPLPHI